MLHYYAELKLIEVSEILGVSIGTCKSRLHTALTTLRRQILKTETIESRKRRASYERN
ncbi:RNA polymerase sigma factor [Paenibacillus illinoisensis]|uniref:RNA polymerase sigma factor n=1 Tax=Paenibacillus illinoisensis TaxID=59845 RepID=A0ABW8HSR5_9BACL